MNPPTEQKLINTYLGSPYYVVLVLLVTLSSGGSTGTGGSGRGPKYPPHWR